jgi:gamma-glutamyltranspeptidase
VNEPATRRGGRRLALATPHTAATEAGVAVFDEGGNAIDAALTACSVLAIVYPHMCSIGGDMIALLHHPGGEVITLNGSGAAPMELSPGDVRAHTRSMPLTGPDTITVPGVMAGWETLRELGATLPIAAILEPAIDHALAGYAAAPSLRRALTNHATQLSRDPGMATTLLPGGVSEETTVIRQPALGETLRTIASDGVTAFYRGDVGRSFVSGVRAIGSKLSDADLGRHQTEIAEPVTAQFRSRRISTAPPNSQGFVLLEILLVLERLGVNLNTLGPDVGTIARVFELASRDRDRYLADPRFSRVPVDELLGHDHIEAVVGDMAEHPYRASQAMGERTALGDTVAVVAADGDGWAVSVIQSVFHAFGSGILEPRTGIICHNRGAGFSLDESSPNVLRGGKRPAHTLMPVFVFNDGRLEIVAGTMGGYAQPQIHAQILGRLFGGADADAAVSNPRWVTGALDAGGRSDLVSMERRAFDRCGPRFESTGRDIVVLDDGDDEVGHAQYVVLRDGHLTAASDPRADGSAAVV